MPVLTAMHWGVYEVELEAGRAVALKPFREDPDPSPIGLHALAPELERLRVRRPAIRKGWLEGDRGGHTRRRGTEPFVQVEWETALDLVAGELRRVKEAHGNQAIFGGSYGWASAGRFHHAQSQVHRFLNSIGGYVRHVDSYSLGAARVLLPHILATMEEVQAMHTSFPVLEQHCRMFVCFGGVPAKNAQISAGGAFEHRVPGALRRMAANGCRFVNISPTRDDLDTGADFEWIPIRPNTDAALMLALGHVLLTEGLHDRDFVTRCTTGFERFAPYLLGETDGQPKSPEWASAITGVPAGRIAALAREMAATRTMINAGWSLQRAHHGEQPFWMALTLACMLGQIGLPGGGIGLGYGPTNLMGSPHPYFGGASLPQGRNAVKEFIPVARISDMLEQPGQGFRYNGGEYRYADIRLIYWAGGNPFHHHQDLGRLDRAWGKPETVVVHEQFWTPTAKRADIVLPATTTLEREDLGFSRKESHVIAMPQVKDPPGEARDDYAIFTDLAARLGAVESFTEGRDTRAWLRHLYEDGRTQAAKVGIRLPGFDAFWQAGGVRIEAEATAPQVMLEAFRQDPVEKPLRTPSGRIEIFSERIAGFGLPDCPGHPAWFEPIEWLGAAKAERFPLHLLSDQPDRRLHSQLDPSPHSQAGKVAGRQPVSLSPQDAAARGIKDGDVVRIFNDRGACLAGAIVTEALAPGVARLSTGAWYDPGPDGLERHGNPNAVTLDLPASALSQGCAAQTCLVEIERWDGPAPRIEAHDLPVLE